MKNFSAFLAIGMLMLCSLGCGLLGNRGTSNGNLAQTSNTSNISTPTPSPTPWDYSARSVTAEYAELFPQRVGDFTLTSFYDGGAPSSLSPAVGFAEGRFRSSDPRTVGTSTIGTDRTPVDNMHLKILTYSSPAEASAAMARGLNELERNNRDPELMHFRVHRREPVTSQTGERLGEAVFLRNSNSAGSFSEEIHWTVGTRYFHAKMSTNQGGYGVGEEFYRAYTRR
jgi:hypothetical protein